MVKHEGGWDVPYEKPGPPKGHAYGVAAVTQALEGIDFPASKNDIIDYAKKRGTLTVHWTKDHEINLEEVLDAVPTQEYESMAGVAHAVHEADEQQQNM